MAVANGFPTLTTSGQGLFAGASSNGWIQGQAYPDPATRWALRSGIVSQSETSLMWGGLPVYADVPPISTTGPRANLGQVIGRATSLATTVGFSVFDQAYNMVTDPANTVPTAGSGQSANYYPLGSRARLCVQAAPSLVNALGGQINAQVSWDFTDELLVPYAPAYTAVTITGATWAATAGGQTTYTVSTNLTAVLAAGDVIDVSGIVASGGTGGSFNGQWVVVSVTSTTVVVVALGATGFYPTYTSGGTIAAAGGALPVTLLEVIPSGNMVVQNIGGAVTYNYNGSAAIIQLTGGTTA